MPLANQTFSDVESGTTLRELHDYLLLKYRLLSRVIGARKLHRSRFFSVNFDYGHQHYIDNLQNQRHYSTCNGKLGETDWRGAFHAVKMVRWARELQDEEEKSRDNEKMKMKKEASMFKRYWSKLEAQAKEMKEKEDLNHQEEFLEETYQEQMSLKEGKNVDWDPIENVVENERATFIETVNLFLMLKDDIPGSDAQLPGKMAVSESMAKKGKPQKQAITESGVNPGLETKSQMRKRLKDGTLFSQGASILVRGTPDNPIELADRIPSLPDDEIDALLEAVSEIKHLLFCRLLLSHASLLSAAIRADSVEEFVSDEGVKDADLRDLCLKMENPDPQEVRDACADLLRCEDEDKDIGRHLATPKAADTGRNKRKTQPLKRPDGRRDFKSRMPKSKKEAQKQDSSRRKHFSKTLGPTEVPDIDFGVVDDEAEYGGQRIRVKICGRYIYNYPSDKAMSRGGWLHFCIIAKNSDFSDAIKLCRRWDEFFELSVLALYQYFPAANWIFWATDREQSQLVTLGFLPYGDMKRASQMTTTRNRQTRRSFGVVEARSFIAGSVKRNDQASCRFIKYLSMQTSRVLVLVRDVADGRILIQPP